MSVPIADFSEIVEIIDKISQIKGKWVRRLISLAITVQMLSTDGVPNDNDPALKAAQDALIRHLNRLHA